MSFYLPRLIWIAFNPLNLLLLLLCVGLLLLLTRWRRSGQRLLLVCCIVLVVLAILPVGRVLTAVLESRFAPLHDLPAHVDGIIVLGGSVDLSLSESLGVPVINRNGERLTAYASLARHYPEATLIFTGGSGDLIPGGVTEAEISGQVLRQLGMDTRRIIFEDQARTTYESPPLIRALREPEAGEVWLLVTSAFHMPRAVGVFRKAGWPVIAYPTDFKTPGIRRSLRPTFDLVGGLRQFHFATRAWIGLLAYRFMGRTDSWLPGERPPQVDSSPRGAQRAAPVPAKDNRPGS